ncbi:P-loop containing nucleoside triphosphate hydrolase protein [Suillus lakei]|nr:P-loop containing nucleoside triphosphate hydrolase protein [Suillus lakei]
MSTAAGIRPSSPSALHQTAAVSSNHTEVGEPPRRTDTCNVVIFGEAGAGKSSLVNLIAGTNTAMTSSDAGGCTTATNVHEVSIQNEMLKVKIFDTPGLDEGPRGTVSDEEARRILKSLTRTLMKQGEIHLIIYCVRGQRAIQALCRNYEFIRSQAKRKVPIVLVVTCLESYQPDMEEWWRDNEQTISNFGMTFVGHACITTDVMTKFNVIERRNQSYDAVCKLIEQCRLSNETGVHTGSLRGITAVRGNLPHRHEESRTAIRKLVKEFTVEEQKEARKGGGSLFVSLMRKLRGYLC